MLISMTESEYLQFLDKTPVRVLHSMESETYQASLSFAEQEIKEAQERLDQAKRRFQFITNARTLRPVLVSTNVIQEIA
ncbi:hypothetical protein Cva_00666 [Caedimonas varicaedens]|uniref:Uncharacterized protein n=1 Tax=Caedimonas varicaedens TaxID=1629334 RepID=A0A0K8MCV0_9PROT|nr:hypothetical protein Cva_00666 [Caedimonas varicaedens]